MSDLSEIISLVESQKTIALAAGHYDDIINRIKSAKEDFHRLGHLLNEKYEAVEQLESKSLNNIFKSILGNKDTELEMERQEYLQVVLQYNEAKKTKELLEYERDVLKKQISQKAIIDLKLEKAIQSHRNDILKAYPDVAVKVIQLEKKISTISANKKEIEEAQSVAQALKSTLEIIITNLDRASNWGEWEDMKLSQKIEVKAKNQFVDKALTKVYVAQMLFEKFEKELNDIYDHQQITGSYHFHDFGNFTEVYYNRLIADWVIKKRIKNSKQNVEGVYDSVSMISSSLTLEIEKVEKKIVALKQQIAFIIKGSISAS